MIRTTSIERWSSRWWRLGGALSEVASYDSPSDLADLRAVLDRYGDDETEQIRSVLERRTSGMRPVANPQDPTTWEI